MNIRPFEVRPAAKPAQLVPASTPARSQRRERDFGVGYGNSSGYASQRRYTSNWVQPLFRCA